MKSGYEIFQLSGPVIMVHSDMPPMLAIRVRGMKTVAIIVNRLTEAFVSFDIWVILLFSSEVYNSMKLVSISRYVSVSSKNFAQMVINIAVTDYCFFRNKRTIEPVDLDKDLPFMIKAFSQASPGSFSDVKAVSVEILPHPQAVNLQTTSSSSSIVSNAVYF